MQDNIVYGAHGAAIVTEDGTESFNVFDHNFAVRAEGAGDRAPRGGYGGSGPDPGSDGSGFWFQGPNNYIRNNVAANAEASGFNLAGRLLGTVRIPAFQSADTSLTTETKPVDAMMAPVLEFANNEAYGAMQNGIECGWNGVITNFRAWNIARYGLMGAPTDRMVIDGLVVRGDATILSDEHEEPAGAWIGNYTSKQIVVRNADIEGVRTGILSPFFSASVGIGGSADARGRCSSRIRVSRTTSAWWLAPATPATSATGGRARPRPSAARRSSRCRAFRRRPRGRRRRSR